LQDPGPFGKKDWIGIFRYYWFRITDKNDQGKTNLSFKNEKESSNWHHRHSNNSSSSQQLIDICIFHQRLVTANNSSSNANISNVS
jgi:predicted RNA-binding protein with RPS1 domain